MVASGPLTVARQAVIGWRVGFEEVYDVFDRFVQD